MMWACASFSAALAWSSYLGFGRGYTAKLWIIKRALALRTKKLKEAWTPTIALLVFAAVAFGMPLYVEFVQSGALAELLVGAGVREPAHLPWSALAGPS